MAEYKRHQGHRQRMRERVQNYGLDSLAEHEALEYVLYLTNAQKDTNGIAHDLIDRFGDFAAVLEASEEELCTVEGVGPSTARMLHLLPQISRYYGRSRTSTTRCIKTTEQMGSYLMAKFAWSDYERAITPDTAMILKVHPSNYRIEGFHEEVGSRELAALAHKHGLLFYEDQGSGALLPDDILVRGGEETTPASVSAGLDLVSCSGDKLLGAAQAGIIMGRRDLVQACGSHPLMRALRPGKLALTALEATLRIYMDGADVAHREVPVLSMLTLPQAHLERRARKLRDRMVAGLDKAGCPCAVELEIVEESSTPGGGSLPTVELPTMCVAVRLVDAHLTVDALKRSLVQDFDTPVVTRTSHDRILFDVRTLVGDRDIETAASTLVACVKKAIAR